LQIFQTLCKQGEATTKDVEVSTQLSLKVVNVSLRELEQRKLVQCLGQSPPLTKEARERVKKGDWDERFNLYSATPHGKRINSFLSRYDPEKPVSNLGDSLDPKEIVESFTTLDKQDVNLLLNKFHDLYFLGAALVSLHYQKHESAASNWLSSCLGGRLSKDEIEKFLANYSGPEGLVVAQTVDRPRLERALIRLAQAVAGKDMVAKWLSRVSYSLSPRGKKIATTLSEQFYPSELGVNENFLRPEKIEAEHGELGRAIGVRLLLGSGLIGLTVYAYWDLFRVARYAPTNTVELVADVIAAMLGSMGCVYWGALRLPNLLIRISYWTKLRRLDRKNEG